MNNMKNQGYGMAAVGLAIVAYSALAYLLDWDLRHPALAVIGIVSLGIGLRRARK